MSRLLGRVGWPLVIGDKVQYVMSLEILDTLYQIYTFIRVELNMLW